MVIAGADTTHADILLSGPDVLGYHCMLCAIKDSIYLLPYPEALVLVNGDIVHPPVTSTTLADPSSSTTNSITSSNNNINNNRNDDKRPLNISKNKASNSSSSSSQEGYVYDNTLASKDADIIKYGRILTHNDRIAFGRFHFFRFEDRDRGDASTSAYTTANTTTTTTYIANNIRAKDNNSGGSNNNSSGSRGGLEVKRGWDYAQEEMLSKNSALMTSQNGHNYDLSPRSHTSTNTSHAKSSRTHHHNSSTPTTSSTGASPTQPQSKQRSNEATPGVNTYKQPQSTSTPLLSTEVRKGNYSRTDDSRKASSDKNGLVNKEHHIPHNKPTLSSLTIPPYHPPTPPTTQPTPLIPPSTLPVITLTNHTSASHTPVPESTMPENLNPKNSATPEAQFIFEKEAKELQIELTLMQQTLADRMAKYQILTKES